MQPYRDSLEHLRHELERLDQMLRRAVTIVRAAHDGQVPDELRGEVISDPQIDRLLHRSNVFNDYWIRQSAAEGALAPIDRALADLRLKIDGRRGVPDPKPFLSLVHVAESFGLSPAEVDLLLIALAPELERGYETLYAYLQDDATRKRPSVDLALNLICRSAAEKTFARGLLSPGAPLLHFHLIELAEEPFDRQPTLLRRFLKLDESVVRYLLTPPVEPPPADVASKAIAALGTDAVTQSRILKTLDALKHRSPTDRPIVQLVSSAEDPPLDVAQAMCASLGRKVMRLTLSDLVGGTRVAIAVRDAALTRAVLVIASGDGPEQDAERQKRLEAERSLWAALAGSHTPVFFVGPPSAFAAVPSDVDLWRLEIPLATFEQRKAMWEQSLGATPAATNAARLADTFKFSPELVQKSVRLASHYAWLGVPDAETKASPANGTPAATTPLNFKHILSAARSLSTPNLTRFALPVIPRFGWGDLVLPDDKKRQLRSVLSRVEHRHLVYRKWGFGEKLSRGKGLTVLFTGPSGTGKTMAAEVLASRLSLILYQIDLSTVISKYIGETEQHLSAIFREAESSQVLLFFDEAEACFGKRTEVKDAHDRYANIEVNYLLQRLEQYEGIVVLATNLYKNLDEAFLRRISEVIEFALPDEGLRERIWQNHFPKTASVSTEPGRAIDIPFLAKHFKLTGGNIKNVVTAAAFAAAPGKIDMGHVVRAIRAEHQKQGKLAMESEFGDYAGLLHEKLEEALP